GMRQGTKARSSPERDYVILSDGEFLAVLVPGESLPVESGWQVVDIPYGRFTHLGCGGRCVGGELKQPLTNREDDTPKLSRALTLHCLLDLHKSICQPRVPTRDQQKGRRGDGLNRAGVLV